MPDGLAVPSPLLFCGLQARFSCFYAGAVCSGPPSPAPLPSGYHRYALRPCCRGPGGIAHRLYNVFEDVLPRKYAQVFEIKRSLLDCGAMAASMSGSGPTVFGIFSERATAEEAREQLLSAFPQTFLCRPVGKMV